jgi:hypothetical protein
MLRKMVGYFTLPAVLLFCAGSEISAAGIPANADTMTGTLEKMIVAGGNVELSFDSDTYRFAADPNSMFSVLVFNHALRNAEQGELGLIWGNSNTLPGSMNASAQQLVLERLASDAAYELAIRDARTGFVFFNVEGINLITMRQRTLLPSLVD